MREDPIETTAAGGAGAQPRPYTPPEPTPSAPTGSASPTTTPAEAPLWTDVRADGFRRRWHELQTQFVEDPKATVAEARQIIDDAVQALADSVHDREEELARAGARTSDSTEGMRGTVLQYHKLLDRVLSV
ncbi:hypothetical protein AB0M46_25155 [Dactylosporangium sp. NPDC051485]|uniref:hypothetical protein n=1 Tax=Dactylosporangium sp. NPDC051485 TaxID=3154846 RepID=UPI003419B616